MKLAIDNSYGHASGYGLDIGFITLLKFPRATVTKYYKQSILT